MSPELKQFIQENKNLINENSKEAWEQIYNKISHGITGEFTETILKIGADPAKILGYIPRSYLNNSKMTNYKIPDNVTSIGEEAFSDCDNLTSITIPDSVTSIDGWAFYNCYSLTSIKIPDRVTSIGEEAFRNCDSLTSVVIGDSVTSIDWGAFFGCDNLTEITLPFVGATKNGTSNAHFGYIFGAGSSNDNNSFVPLSLQKVTITDGSSIGDSAFEDCDNLTSITIPDSVTSIGDWAFSDCTSLKEIKFKGTKKQAIECGIGNRDRNNWRKNSSISKVICTDGVIKLQ